MTKRSIKWDDKDERNKYQKLMRSKHPDKYKGYKRKYYERNKQKILETAKRYYMETIKKNYKLKRDAVKRTVFEYYSKCVIRCACCGETDERFLTIDHIHGKKKHGHNKNSTGMTLWRWLIRNNFPSGFQILCMNCNWAKGQYGECPHKETEKTKLLDDEIIMLKKLQ